MSMSNKALTFQIVQEGSVLVDESSGYAVPGWARGSLERLIDQSGLSLERSSPLQPILDENFRFYHRRNVKGRMRFFKTSRRDRDGDTGTKEG